ncbi:sensor histidine kinase [Streptomyces pseudovenezuelae]|uniref:histidine kinase n=1 Tax=Streptomyces pseudovenezuelae TaxID=67350 RepID=A0ABT6LZ95_9ACTN|nr:histidine kinase [Streptomyces pseudovenezuelae]MDH6221613.1 signal transduction histidine kinase [Streptomyces pseudovenezuelae]
MAYPAITHRRIAALAARHPQAVDVIIGVLLALVYLLAVWDGKPESRHPGRDLHLWDAVAAIAIIGLVTARRHRPRLVLVLTMAATVITIAVGEARSAQTVTAAIAAYTVASTYPRRTAYLFGGSAAALLYGASLIWPGPEWPGAAWWERGDLSLLAGVGMAVAVGDALRTRRAYLAAVEERARRAEQSREEEAHRRVMEERLRIARELHDVVAHHLALISVQAGVAKHLMQSEPEQAKAALGHVRDAAGIAVEELGTVLAVLRRHDDPDQSTAPAPGLAHVPELLDTVAAAGLHVRYRQAGRPRPLPAATDLAAYRIIQESLTNAHKHAAGTAVELHLAYAGEGLTINVTNPHHSPRDTQRPASGHGLIGMQERAAALGGTLQAAPAVDGTFTVHAFLPAADPSGASP